MSGTVSMSAVAIVDVTPRLAAVVRQEVGYAGMGDAQRRARPLLDAALRVAQIAPAGPRLTIWRSVEGGRVDYAPGIFIPGPIEEAGAVSLLTLPRGRAAHLKLSGSYADLPTAWERLFAGCAGHAPSGLNWEIYSDTQSDELVTDLYVLLT